MTRGRAWTRSGLGTNAALVAVALLLLIVLQKAWLSDDAYITFRAIDNWVEGRGLVWNAGERVQVYTHPLWMLGMSALRALSGEFYYTAIALGSLLTLVAALGLALGLAASWPAALLGVALLAASRAFTDYSTAGLENPLAHALLVALLWLDAPRAPGFWARARFSLVASLCLLVRLDLLWLVAPAWAAFVWRTRGPRSVAALALGLAPLAAWALFALLYYGAPLPNTAYAKLATGIGAGELAVQGLRYLGHALVHDPVLLPAVAAGALAALAPRGPGPAASAPAAPRAWALGILALLAYVVRVGGDFMSGRFLTAPLLVAVALLVSRPLPPRPALAAAALGAALLAAPWTTPFAERDYGPSLFDAIDAHGIADERAFYLESSSLRAASHWDPRFWPDPWAYGEAQRFLNEWPDDEFARRLAALGVLRPEERWPPDAAVDAQGRPLARVLVRGAVGMVGFHLGARAHVLDYHGITDPLLAHLPVDRPDPVLGEIIPRLAGLGWRVGHYYRRPPLGYVRTLATGRNQIRSEPLAAYYEVLRSLTRDPVFDPERLATLWRFQLGAYDALLEEAIAKGY